MTSTTEPGPHAQGSSARRRRWRWVLPALVVVAWLALGGPLGSFAGRLSEVQTNDNAGFLPVSAESTEVQRLQEQFAQSETFPAVLVWELDRPITAEDTAAVAADLARVQQVDGIVGEVVGPIPAEDGTALSAVASIDAADATRAGEIVTAVRAVVAPDGDQAAGALEAKVYVTGPAGFLADITEAFGEIDGILLLTTVTVVLLILLLVYRSPILPFVVLFCGILALGSASATVYLLADADVITLNGQSQGILFILVLGATTDYSLLLVARFREELREHHSRYDAMRAAWRGTVEPVLASGSTVIAGLLCLLFSDLASNRGLGPVAAIGIAFSLLSALTFLPAALLLLGRGAFWPFRPAFGSEHSEVRGRWGRVARLVARRHRAIWIGTAAGLLALAAFAPTFEAEGTAQSDVFLVEVEAVTGQDVLARHFPAGSGSPVVVIGPEDQLDAMTQVVAAQDGISSVRPTVDGDPTDPAAPPLVVDGLVELTATLDDAPDSPAATAVVQELRVALDEVSPEALVGGETAQQLDVTTTAQRDVRVIIPIVLAVILLVLVLLLRSLLAPVLLIATVVLSFASTLGAGALVFDHVFGWPGADPSVPLFAFVFLVALGIDYNIFLMTRVREESLRRGTRPGIVHGLAVTGGVITSAGVVLAATFSALAVLPLLFLAQLAFLVAFGVLLDTIVVRSLLVPALSYDIGPRIWWPSRLARAEQPAAVPADDLAAPSAAEPGVGVGEQAGR